MTVSIVCDNADWIGRDWNKTIIKPKAQEVKKKKKKEEEGNAEEAGKRGI